MAEPPNAAPAHSDRNEARTSTSARSATRDLAPPHPDQPLAPEASLEKRMASLEDQLTSLKEKLVTQDKREAQQDVRLIEQEHRVLAVWRNFFRYWFIFRPTDTTDEEKANWEDRKRASAWALLWRILFPGATVAIAGGISALLASGGALYLAYRSNELVADQNAKFDAQNELVRKQNEYFQEQNASVQAQLTQDRDQDYVARRAELFATLYDRQESCPEDGEPFCAQGRRISELNILRGAERLCAADELVTRCPVKASLRAREEALGAFIQIERTRNPHPLLPSTENLQRLSLSQVDLRKADLFRFDLRFADLSFAQLDGANLLRTHLEGTHLRGAHLEGANLSEAHLQNADLLGADFEGADLREAHLERAYLFFAHLEDANLGDADLENANLEGAHLQGADLREAHLENAYLFLAHLQGANLKGAHLEGANLQWAGLADTHLEGADLRGARGLTAGQLSEAYGNENTQLPEGIVGVQWRQSEAPENKSTP